MRPWARVWELAVSHGSVYRMVAMYVLLLVVAFAGNAIARHDAAGAATNAAVNFLLWMAFGALTYCASMRWFVRYEARKALEQRLEDADEVSMH